MEKKYIEALQDKNRELEKHIEELKLDIWHLGIKIEMMDRRLSTVVGNVPRYRQNKNNVKKKNRGRPRKKSKDFLMGIK